MSFRPGWAWAASLPAWDPIQNPMHVFTSLPLREIRRKSSRLNRKASPMTKHSGQPSLQFSNRGRLLGERSPRIGINHMEHCFQNAMETLHHPIWLVVLRCGFDEFGSQVFYNFSPQAWFKLAPLCPFIWREEHRILKPSVQQNSMWASIHQSTREEWLSFIS